MQRLTVIPRVPVRVPRTEGETSESGYFVTPKGSVVDSGEAAVIRCLTPPGSDRSVQKNGVPDIWT
jgi:hypothetical protein